MIRKTGTERREQIVEATIGVLLAKGLAAATTRDVTGTLGVGAGLLSHYFTWAELRALAFERIVRADLQRTIDVRAEEPSAQVLKNLIGGAFLEASDPVWQVWIEASDLATVDRMLADAVARCIDLWRDGLIALLERGNATGTWLCADPEGASWRLLALFDGLVGLVMAPHGRLSRGAATAHLAVAVGYECR